MISQLKELSILALTIALKFFATMLNIEDGARHFLFAFFFFIMFLPEMLILFNKDFRSWMRTGIEDGDSKFEKADLQNLLIHYSTLWCTRLYVTFGLLEAFYGTQVRDVYVVGSLAGAFGIEVIGFLLKKSKPA